MKLVKNYRDTKQKVYVFHSDSGHGWLAVKRKELEDLNILDKISSCSYQSETGKTVYLEEDCDGSLFVTTYEKKYNTDLLYRGSYQERSFVRNLPLFEKNV